uniref:Uncharacterized protein n=1 Tax=Helianthus annuus TaxID=4232 RepID=A0A251SCY4_HELAN
MHIFNQLAERIQLFLRWAIIQGVAMLLHNIYQTYRLYTRLCYWSTIWYVASSWWKQWDFTRDVLNEKSVLFCDDC